MAEAGSSFTLMTLGGTRKWCFVPGCISSSAKTPNKLFVNVPKDVKRRRLWASAAKREDGRTVTSKNPWYCCEDHFEVGDPFCNAILSCECVTIC